MKVGEGQSRDEYIQTQINASRKKFLYCKVSVHCVERWKETVFRCAVEHKETLKGPILCLGTRNGREIDLFRTVFFSNRLIKTLVRIFERRIYCFSSRFPLLEAFDRSDIRNIHNKSVIGVELNPDGRRKDVYVGSFDEMPKEWEGRFSIVYSNTLDHAFDPYKTAKEWYRVLAPGGYMILGFPDEERDVSAIDHVGNIYLDDLRSLFPGELIYFNKYGNALRDAIIKKS